MFTTQFVMVIFKDSIFATSTSKNEIGFIMFVFKYIDLSTKLRSNS